MMEGNCGLRIADCGIKEGQSGIADRGLRTSRNPQSAINDPAVLPNPKPEPKIQNRKSS
jgi:hypothetical protein